MMEAVEEEVEQGRSREVITKEQPYATSSSVA